MDQIIDFFNFLNKTKEALLLKPHKAEQPLSFQQSKMGGIPNLEAHQHWPVCKFCNFDMQFITQFYREEFNQFYFPEGKNLFQVFRCHNMNCPNEDYDVYTEVYYFNVENKLNKDIRLLNLPTNNMQVYECYFKPKIVIDYPHYLELPEYDEFDKKFANTPLEDLFWESYQPKIGSKLNGYPAWSQEPNYPVCSCGKQKELIYQLHSEDLEDGQKWPPKPNEWSSHGIMIGDVGALFFFICKKCGEDTIEICWDCG